MLLFFRLLLPTDQFATVDRVNETMVADNGDNDHCADSWGKGEGHIVTTCNAEDRGDYSNDVADSADEDIDL